ncbi:MAG: hypothetical protein GEV03_21785 [Streptosporangiales bacterium]|nr:hypothetical protein [Streptosporangiales bacterium]
MAQNAASWPEGTDWLAGLVGVRAAEVLRRYTVPTLQRAHEEALARHGRAIWANETTYGVERYHCFCHMFGAQLERWVPGAVPRWPENRFVVQLDDVLVYPFKYGDRRSARLADYRFRREENAILRRLEPTQPTLPFPGLPLRDGSTEPGVVLVPYCVNREQGLVRVVLGQARRTPDRYLLWSHQEELYSGPDAPDGPPS